MQKRKDFKNGASITIEKLFPSGMYLVELWGIDGSLKDKIRTDDYDGAMAYYKSFAKIAKNYKGV